ncbi:malto-oligosyltrehalose trehalohydrolase [Ornithinicoccus hortensis]|uniref:Malto-oligosyltrehalose trehalohydrolase n=1 Tax=Ornithinicoccus hortensis TaxID=82346 RepID=A0A542YNY2_9MICO|nr:malto-oligosyltrehalose trehalohydrolase [Ornithinicoccus hortensis]TQL49808.1 maltooligosyl trehalose hydrolase [Ornithinicoccus hortensis]
MGDRLRVWAPAATRVEVVHGPDADRRTPMESGSGGWWSLDWDRVGTDASGATRYAFALDGGDPRPDPRSLSQPGGVHAPSRRLDLTAYRWGDEDWAGQPLEGSSVYELHVGTFTPAGTLDAAIERLDHLVDLGVTTVELMPLAAFPGVHGWGYDGVALYAVHEPYGGARALQRFVDAAHCLGLAVWLDVVYNHLGPSGNYLGQFGPYFTERYHTPWGAAVNLDGPGSDEVRAFLLDNVRMWLTDFHLDGLRLDAVHELHDGRALTLLEEVAALADEVAQATGVPRTVVAESDRNDPGTVAPRGAGSGGLGLAGQWADDVHHALHVALTGETDGYYADFDDPSALPRALGGLPFFHDGTYSTFRGRVHGRPVDPAETPSWRFVASLQTHDQVGNRAVGDRLAQLAGRDRAAVGAALLLTAPFTPMLFMGEEWGAGTPWQYFTDHQEPELAEAIRAGRRREFASHGWGREVPDPQDPATLEASRLDWSEPQAPGHAELLAWHRTLLSLRRDHPGLVASPGDVPCRVLREGGGDVLRVERGVYLVLANLGDQERQTALPHDDHVEHAQLAGWGRTTVRGDGTALLGPASVLVLAAGAGGGPPAAADGGVDAG